MKALIVGAGGQLGRALQAEPPGDIRMCALTEEDLDLTDKVAVRQALEVQQPDLIINAAAYTAVDRAETERAKAVHINTDAVALLAKSAKDCGARLVHISTDFVFDGMSTRPYRPDDTPAPLNVYGQTKWKGELAVGAISNSLIVRTSWLYDAGGQNFMKTMLRLFREKSEVRVVSDQVGTPTAARSLARAVWQLAESDATGILHFTDSGVASWYDFAVAIQEEALAAGLLTSAVPIVPVSTAEYPTLARRPAFSVLDKADTWKIIGGPAPHWRVLLRTTIRELQEND